MTKDILTERQKAILDYITKKENNGASLIKERIIETLTKEGKGSRKTILKDINTLVGYKMLYIDKEKPNSQVHYVHKDRRSILLSVMDDLSRFKESFLLLIDETKEVFDEIYQRMRYDKGEDLFQDQLEIVHAQQSLQTLFRHLIEIYLLYFVLVWPKEIADKETLNSLYTIVFERIKERQIKLSEAFRPSDLQYTYGDIVKDSFVLQPDKLLKTITNLEYIGVGKFEKVLDHLWRIGFRFVPDAILGAYQYNQYGKKHRLEKLDKQEDWRNVVKTYLDDPGNEEEKDWSRAIHAKRTKIQGRDCLST